MPGRGCNMSHNTFGHLFRVTTWGESHGPALGCVVDGCPPGIRFTLADIQAELDKRRPGQSRFVTQRREPDEVKILSGVMSRTARRWSPPARRSRMLIENVDQRSKDYGEIARQYRPGHADYTYDAEIRHSRLSRRRPLLGARDRRAGRGRRAGAQGRARHDGARRAGLDGRARRSTAPTGTGISSATRKIPFFTPDPASCRSSPTISTASARPAPRSARSSRSSPKACRPASARRSTPSSTRTSPSGLMSINAVKGVEIGNGFDAAKITGEENADEMRMGNDGKPVFLSNNAGGILGGISTGQPIVARFAVKPTSSILTPRRSIDARRQRCRHHDQGPPRPLRRHPRRADRRGDGCLRHRRPLSAPPRTDRERQ